MSQISPPMRILLIGAIVFLAAWFALLRPHGGTDTASTATPDAGAASTPAAPSSAPGQTVQSAQSAADSAAAADAASAGETTDSTASTAGAAAATTPATKPAGAAGAAVKGQVKSVGLPLPVATALAERKVTVLYFWNPKADDDRLVRAALKGIDHHHGKVVVHVADVKDVARYAAITRGVDLEQSPSVVVLDKNRAGTILTGYVDRLTIEQAVSDALRAR